MFQLKFTELLLADYRWPISCCKIVLLRVSEYIRIYCVYIYDFSDQLLLMEVCFVRRDSVLLLSQLYVGTMQILETTTIRGVRVIPKYSQRMYIATIASLVHAQL